MMKPRASTPLWLWLNLLSLDAPLVALVWQDFAADRFNSPLRPAGRWALGLTVWAIYLADRLIDIRHPAPENETVRHGFYREHHRFAHALLTIVILVDVSISLIWLRPAVLANGLFLGVAVALYLVGFAVLLMGGSWIKRPAAAILFTTGVLLVAFTTAGDKWDVLVWPAISFFLLCLGNLVLIENWELQKSRKGWLWMVALCLLCAWLFLDRMNQYGWYSAILLSAAGLALLDALGSRLSQNARRVLADLVLLTPLIWR
jgi:hypothetical protein